MLHSSLAGHLPIDKPGRRLHISKIAATAPVIPVVTIDALEDAVPLARALLADGLRVIEITLRTPVAPLRH